MTTCGSTVESRLLRLAVITLAGAALALGHTPKARATLTVANNSGSVTVTESAPFRSGNYSTTKTSTPPGYEPQAAASRVRLWSHNITVWGFASDTVIGSGCSYVFGGPGVGIGNSIECGTNDEPVTSVKWELGEGSSGFTVTDTLNVPLVLKLGAGSDAVSVLASPAAPVSADGGPGPGDSAGAYPYCVGGTCPTTGVSLRLSGGVVSGIPNLTATNFEALQGSAGPDTLTGSANPVTEGFTGANGNDVIDDGGGPDIINAGDGDDTIKARDGARDQIFCGKGTDSVEVDVDGPAPTTSWTPASTSTPRRHRRRPAGTSVCRCSRRPSRAR